MSAPDGFSVFLANQQTKHAVEEAPLIAAARLVLRDSRFTSAEISLAVVDDKTIHDLNKRYLEHDYPTDVLSFVLDEQAEHLEGEVIISADTAAAQAVEIGWPPAAEQLLYVVHGMLHLIGYRDETPAETSEMRTAERRCLREFGYEQPGTVAPSPTGRGLG